MSELGANDGSDLIVDFGHRHPRRTSNTTGGGGGKVSATKTMAKEKQVNFSEDVIVHYFQYPSKEEVSKRWHSKSDKSFFTQELARDVRRLRGLLSVAPIEGLEKEALYDCVGLEALMSSRVMRFLKDHKREHSRSIVEMQDSLNDEQLAAYAASHSSQSRERAQQIAAGYLEILP